MAPIKVLLQTTIPMTEDDWSIRRFSLLRRTLTEARDMAGHRLFAVTARDRIASSGPDPVISRLESSGYDVVWLFAVDTGSGLTPEDCAGLDRFRRLGGGLLTARDHMDLGSSLCGVPEIGAAHEFHTHNPDPDPDRRQIDDRGAPEILWPNYHSGANGDVQEIEATAPLHPALADPEAPDGQMHFLPAHPHEGSVVPPAGAPHARTIARGRSQVTNRRFNVAVAFEATAERGPAIAYSTFHHFADYNWDPSEGAPSFVHEPPGNGLSQRPDVRRAIERYVQNISLWLAGTSIEDFWRDAELDAALAESFPASDPPTFTRREPGHFGLPPA